MESQTYNELFRRDPELVSDGDGLYTGLAGAFTSEIHSCCNPSHGFMRLSGSQIRHLEIKSRKSTSLHFRAWLRLLEPGFRRLPLELTTSLGLPFESFRFQAE